jgi:four helix bundle protein
MTVTERSLAFAIRVVDVCENLCEDKKKYTLAKKLLSCGTGVGANVTDALTGRGKKHFADKMNSALKNCAQTEYWIRLFAATEYIGKSESEAMMAECIELQKIMKSMIKHTTEHD